MCSVRLFRGGGSLNAKSSGGIDRELNGAKFTELGRPKHGKLTQNCVTVDDDKDASQRLSLHQT
jgi:hypothetical protein